jgi:hypothetical protein
VLAGLALAALAAPTRTQASDEIDFSLIPLGAHRYFDFKTRPGQTVAGQLGVLSRADHRQTVIFRAVDVGTAATGGLDYGLLSPRRVGRWLTLARRSVTLAPGERVNVPFEAHVPDVTGPGDHLAGLVAYNPGGGARQRRTRPRGLRLAFRSRLAAAVLLRLPGRRHSQLEFRGAHISVSPSGARIHLRLRNAGNELIKRTGGEVTVSHARGDLLKVPVDLGAFAPDSEILYPLLLPGTPVQGSYHVTGTLQPDGARRVRIAADVELTGHQATRFEQATGKKVTRPSRKSPLLIAAIVFPLLSAGAFAVGYRSARRQLRSQSQRP